MTNRRKPPVGRGERVFLDSGIFIAALSRRDRWHEQAAALFERSGVRMTTSLLVVSECHSWFLHRHGEQAARQLQGFVAALDRLTLLEATLEHHTRTLRMLDRLRGSSLTYVDADSLAWLEVKKIDTVWGTDHHLGLTGAQVLPRD